MVADDLKSQSLSARDKNSAGSGDIKDIIEKQRASVNRLSQAKKVISGAQPDEESRTSPRRMPENINE